MKLTKKFVSVVAKFNEDGITPLSIRWADGRVFEIDRMLDVRPAASVTVGGIGIRYICMIAGKERLLYYEELQCLLRRKAQAFSWVFLFTVEFFL